MNTAGSYRCVCNIGYSWNGEYCLGRLSEINVVEKKVLECARRLFVCYNLIWYYFPLDVDECASKEHNCDQNALCINLAGRYKCVCKEGFEQFKEGRYCIKKEGKHRYLTAKRLFT